MWSCLRERRSPQRMVQKLDIELHLLATADGDQSARAQVAVGKYLIQVKSLLLADPDGHPNAVADNAHLVQEIYHANLLQSLIANLVHIGFEGRKDVALIFNNLLLRQSGRRFPTVSYLCARHEILFTLMTSYGTPSITMHCGDMLRTCARHEPLAKIMLHSDKFYGLFPYIDSPAFDIGTDVFLTVRVLLTFHKQMAAEFLEQHYDEIFERFEKLVRSDNYATRRQSLVLLGELLVTRSNMDVAFKYISSVENLQFIVGLLEDSSEHNQFEAFHILKLFVTNPHMPNEILTSLLLIQQKLLTYLAQCLPSRDEDEMFIKEKNYVIKLLKQLKPETTG